MKKILIALFALTISLYAYASDEHEHDEKSEAHEKHEEEEEHGEHSDHDKHEEKEHAHNEHGEEHEHGKDEHGHGEEEEGSSSVGPDKGITEKSENGFKLSAEAVKTMEIKMTTVGTANLTIEKKTLILVKDEKSVFRIRDGWIKRVPVQVLNRSGDSFVISSSQLKDGDQIVVHGTGFLRIAEVFATEGASHGHSH